MSQNLGDFAVDSVINFFFGTYDSSGASVTVTNFVSDDIHIWKNGTLATLSTVKATNNGIAINIDAGGGGAGNTGIHRVVIDTSVDTGDSGFWVAGSDYYITANSITIDSQTVRAPLGSFSIENRYPSPAVVADAVWDESVATHSGTTSAGNMLNAIQANSVAISTETSILVDTRIPDTISLANIQGEVDAALVSIRLNMLIATANTSNVTSGSYLSHIMDDGSTTYVRGTHSLQVIGDSGGGGPTAATIADAVWDEAVTGHTGTTKMGQLMLDIQANTKLVFADTTTLADTRIPDTISLAAIADAIWDENVSTHAGTTAAGNMLNAIQSNTVAISTETSILVDTRIPEILSLANIKTQADTALTDLRLDMLISTANTSNVTSGSYLSHIMDDGSTVYDRTTDSLQAVRDNQAGAAPTAATVADAVWDEDITGHTGGVKMAGLVQAIQANTKIILSDTNDLQTQIGTAGAGLLDLGGMSTAMLAEVQGEVDASLITIHLDHLLAVANTSNPITLTYMDFLMNKNTSFGFDRSTDSIEGIADTIGALNDIDGTSVTVTAMAADVLTASALATSAAEEIADAVWDENITGHTGGVKMAGLVQAIQANTKNIETGVNALETNVPDIISLSNIQGEVDTALVTIHLDHLLAVANTSNPITLTYMDFIFNSDTSFNFNRSTDSLEALGTGSAPTAATIADAVWDESITGHTGGVKMAGLVQAIQANTKNIQAVTTNLPDSGALSTIDQNIDDVELIVRAIQANVEFIDTKVDTLHDTRIPEILSLANIKTQSTTALTDIRLDMLVSTANTSNVTSGSYLSHMMDDGSTIYDRTTDSLQAIRDNQGGSSPSAATIADAVWNETVTGHSGAAQMGGLVLAVQANTKNIQAVTTNLPDSGALTTIDQNVDDVELIVRAIQANVEFIDTKVDTLHDTRIPDVISLIAIRKEANTAIVFNDLDQIVKQANTQNPTAGSYLDHITSDGVGTFSRTEHSLIAIAANAAVTAAVTDATIADAVWNEVITGHTGGTQMGGLVQAIQANTKNIQAVTTNLPDSGALTTIDGNIDDVELIVRAIQANTELIDTNINTLITNVPEVISLIAIRKEANTALIFNRLDEIVFAANTEVVATGSLLDHLMANNHASIFDRDTDSLQAIASNTVAGGGAAPTAAAVADAVWEEAIADHSGTSGSTAESLNAAGGAGDPWITSIPGSYVTGQAGHVLGNVANTVWAYSLINAGTTADSVGAHVKTKLLTVAKFLGL